MRIFKDHVEVISEIKRDLFEMGIVNKSYSMQNKIVSWNDDYDTKELLNYSYIMLSDEWIEDIFKFKEFVVAEIWKMKRYAKEHWIENKAVINKLIQEMLTLGLKNEAEWLENNWSMDLEKEYDKAKEMVAFILNTWAKLDFEERTGPVAANPWKAWKLRFYVWSEFTVWDKEEERKFDYSYSERIHWKLETIIKELNAHPTSRQLIIPIFEPQDLQHLGWNRRVPCSIYYQYILRKTWNKWDYKYNNPQLEDWYEYALSIVYNQRSCDTLTHMVVDNFMATKMLRYAHERLEEKDIKLGWLYHNITSLHAYKIDWDKKVF